MTCRPATSEGIKAVSPASLAAFPGPWWRFSTLADPSPLPCHLKIALGAFLRVRWP